LFKVQPILVNFKNADHAKQINSSARHLRKFAVNLVRDNVFINPNVTKTEEDAISRVNGKAKGGPDSDVSPRPWP